MVALCGSGSTQTEYNLCVLSQIIVLPMLATAAASIVFLGVFGRFRRRCSSRAFACVGFTAYSLLPATVAYMLGLLQDSPRLVLFIYFVIALGGADSYTAHSIKDIEQWRSVKVDSAAKWFMASWLIASNMTRWTPSHLTWAEQILITIFLFVLLFMKVDERAQALKFASNFMMQKNYKLVADYMSTEHQRGISSDEDPTTIDPTTMRGCKYLVRVPKEGKVLSLCSIGICKRKAAPWDDGEAPLYRQSLRMTDEVVTVEKVWNCEGRLLRDSRLKDLCLSFSLSKFICMRFAGYSLPPEAHDKLGRLIQHMLSEEDSHERVFRVIEVELAFLFDLFYTKYPVNLNPRSSVCKLVQLAIMVAPLILIYWQEDVYQYPFFFLIISVLLVEFAQFAIMIFSEWAKVKYICKYVQSKWWQKNRCAEKLIEIMCGVWLLKPWGRQLRQYSLLHSYGYSPWKCITNRLTTAYLDLRRNGQKEIAPANLSKKVTEAIAWSLRNNHTGNLEKGHESLRHNNVSEELSWACDLETTTHVILVWHIATTFCEHEVPLRDTQSSPEQRDIAIKLSQYLAYLVAFAPRLLPGHACRTEYIFDRAVSEARDFFGGSSVSVGDRMRKLKDTGSGQSQETIMSRGARLGRQLVTRQVDVWTVLADFWTEMMLYVAPSDDPTAHATYLTMGGEFVTHVWVLVSHAGFKRDPHSGEQHDDPGRN